MKAEIDHIAVTMLLDIDNVQLESGLIYTHIHQEIFNTLGYMSECSCSYHYRNRSFEIEVFIHLSIPRYLILTVDHTLVERTSDQDNLGNSIVFYDITISINQLPGKVRNRKIIAAEYAGMVQFLIIIMFQNDEQYTSVSI